MATLSQLELLSLVVIVYSIFVGGNSSILIRRGGRRAVHRQSPAGILFALHPRSFISI